MRCSLRDSQGRCFKIEIIGGVKSDQSVFNVAWEVREAQTHPILWKLATWSVSYRHMSWWFFASSCWGCWSWRKPVFGPQPHSRSLHMASLPPPKKRKKLRAEQALSWSCSLGVETQVGCMHGHQTEPVLECTENEHLLKHRLVPLAYDICWRKMLLLWLHQNTCNFLQSSKYLCSLHLQSKALPVLRFFCWLWPCLSLDHHIGPSKTVWRKLTNMGWEYGRLQFNLLWCMYSVRMRALLFSSVIRPGHFLPAEWRYPLLVNAVDVQGPFYKVRLICLSVLTMVSPPPVHRLTWLPN